MRHVCKQCNKRPANFENGRGKRTADRDHDLCRRCMISLVNKNKAARMKVAYV